MTTLVGSLRVDQLHPSDSRQVADFVSLPGRLHGAAGQWAPSMLDREVRRALDPGRHPFYEHSNAAFFLAYRNETCVGRIGAIDHTRFPQSDDRRTGFFGYFESTDDDEVATGLLEAAGEWLEAVGADVISGPRGLMSFDGTALVEGFEHPACVGVPWNPPYYDRLITGAGFEKERDYLSGWFPPTHQLDPRIHAAAARASRDGGYSIRSFRTRRELVRNAPAVARVFTQAMSTLPTFVPLSDAELDNAMSTLVWLVLPAGIKLVEKHGAPVGFLFSYPDIAAAMRRSGGRLMPTGWWHLASARRTERAWAINGLGLLPEHRGSGANAVLYTAIADALLDEIGVSRVEVVQVAEDNIASFKDMNALGVRWYKRHRHYRRTVWR